MIIVQECARMTAESTGISDFKASSGVLNRVLNRSGVHNSFKLHGNGNYMINSSQDKRMEIFFEILKQYQMRNIYNQGLIWFVVPHRFLKKVYISQ